MNELRRLENIFSLYNFDSDVSRLNQDGVLENPAFELVELLSLCSTLNKRTTGAFDPTIQPLWALYAGCFSRGRQPTATQITNIRERIGWDAVEYSPDRIAYRQPEMAMTLNGIAQGFIADKIASLLRRNGVRNVLVNTGEIMALGTKPDAAAWQVSVRGLPGSKIDLSDRAIATSATLGTTFDAEESVGHILDPRTGYPGEKWPSVTVISPSAAEADGLSTGFTLMNRPEIEIARGANDVHLVK